MFLEQYHDPYNNQPANHHGARACPHYYFYFRVLFLEEESEEESYGESSEESKEESEPSACRACKYLVD